MLPPNWTAADLTRFFPQPIRPIRSSWLYRAGLLGVAASLVLLQAAYLAMVALAAWATYKYATWLPSIFESVRLNYLTIFLVTPAVAGAIVTFFLLKPLLARPASSPELLELAPTAEPLLYAFIRRLCSVLGAPVPTRVDVDLQVNASASLRRGWRSLPTRDLALTLGLPLAAGLTIRQFTGVLAHELGHFSQNAGMRVSFLVRAILHWFERVVYERDRWDVRLDYWRKHSDMRIRAILAVANGCVHLSRLILHGLLYVAHIVSNWFSRQMEFDADRREAAVVGPHTFEETLTRLNELGVCAHNAWITLETSWRARLLCDDFPLLVKCKDASLTEDDRRCILESAFREPLPRWTTHPPAHDRIASISSVESILTNAFPPLPAEGLFADFAALSRKATLHHYALTIGDEIRNAAVVPASQFIAETGVTTRGAEALHAIFGPLNQPSRWFRLPEEPAPGDAPDIFLPLEDDTAEYWRLLDESLRRYAALEFVRAGGLVEPAAFCVSDSTIPTIESEARASREALEAEIARLRQRYRNHGYLLPGEDNGFRAAYRALSAEQEALLELSHRCMALNVVRGESKALPADASAKAREHHTARVRECSEGIIGRLSAFPAPALGKNAPKATLAERILLSSASRLDPGELATRILDRADVLSAQILGELCAASPARQLR